MTAEVHRIFNLNEGQSFNEDEVYEILPLVYTLSNKVKNDINSLNSQLEIFKGQLDKTNPVNDQINRRIQKWSEKIRRLGGIPIGLCRVKFPTYGGHYLWEYPNSEIQFIN